MTRVSVQIEIIEDTIQEFIRRGKINGGIAIPRVMNIYSRCLELLAPVINLVRIGLELKRGKPSPVKKLSLSKNIALLKADSDYGQLFDCLDEMIRHSDAHVSVQVDKAKGEVHLMDSRGRKMKHICTYKFEEIMAKAQVIRQELLPALISVLMLHELAALDLVLISREYKFLLLAIGNC